MIIPVKYSDSGYDIIIEKNAISHIKDYINPAGRAVVVSDDNVPEQYWKSVSEQFENTVTHIIPHGEQSKCMTEFCDLLSKMLSVNFTRKDCVIAVGGGVVGDLSGFAAACYMRGIDFYNIPTTLLSQIDSSIGGKTAIDFDGIKNVVGAFHQPRRVVIDPEVLSTLDKRQLMAGLAEAIKIAATCDAELFELICKSDNLYNDISEIIARAVNLKKEVVEKDPKESHLRKVLNFGHTIGHGVESYCQGDLLHGECVA
ncbi:MAG: 3-dehydroquinate synthase, partial [Clostridia bacterium]|nr:3-dehydroquinate synthase [Clostridia bacterium]